MITASRSIFFVLLVTNILLNVLNKTVMVGEGGPAAIFWSTKQKYNENETTYNFKTGGGGGVATVRKAKIYENISF